MSLPNQHKIGLNDDGGGVKGIITLYVLNHIEKMLGKKLHNYINFVSGASTGTIVGAGVSSGDFWCEELLELYLESSPKIFDKKFYRKGLFIPKYSAEPIEDMFLKAFGDKKISDLKVEDTLFVSVNATRRKFLLHKKSNPEVNGDLIRDVCRWSSCAPSYFPIAYRNGEAMIDGGMAINSPSMMLYTMMIEEAFGFNKSVISIGTGKYEYKVSPKRWWGLLKWLEPLFDIMLSEMVDVTDRYMQTQFDKRFDNVGDYFRLNIDLTIANSDMDDASPANLKALLKEGEKLVMKEARKIEKIVKTLSENEK